MLYNKNINDDDFNSNFRKERYLLYLSMQSMNLREKELYTFSYSAYAYCNSEILETFKNIERVIKLM